MSDNRRRRKQQSGGSDDFSDSNDELNATKETQSSEQTEEQADSEYGTATGSDSENDSQDKNLRESGDGQEEEEDKQEKKLDDDEDRRNPQYIPKKGTFYEHDDRTAEEMNEVVEEPQPERESKDKKVWKEKDDKWHHDRYNDVEQAPKSHAELIAIYGYDIRNEEGPPRARRRRRYGRGPNKYTRNWEDEDAYGIALSTATTPKKINKKYSRSKEEFPALNANKENSKIKKEQPVITSAWYSNKNKIQNKVQDFPSLSVNHKTKVHQGLDSSMDENKISNEKSESSWQKETKNVSNNQNANESIQTTSESEKMLLLKASMDKKLEPTNLALSRARGRGFRAITNNNLGNRIVETKPNIQKQGRGNGRFIDDNQKSNVEFEQDNVISDMKHLNLSSEVSSQYHNSGRQNKNYYPQASSQHHTTVIPPRLQQSHVQQTQPQQPPQQQHQQQLQQQHPPQQQPQQPDASVNRPKRYSSLRQRPQISEGPTPQNYQPPQHTYYPAPQVYTPNHYDQAQPVPPPSASLAGQPVIPIPPGPQPTSYAPPAFLVPPPQFIPPQTAPPSIINYVPGPNGPIFQPNYQNYNPAPVQGPPQELYQPQGCTYYNPVQQHQLQQQQAAPLRRPKVAIPIISPTETSQSLGTRGRGKNISQQQNNMQTVNYQEFDQSENKNDIVNSSFVESNMETEEYKSDTIEQIIEKEEEPTEVVQDTIIIEEKLPTIYIEELSNKKNIETGNDISNETTTVQELSNSIKTVDLEKNNLSEEDFSVKESAVIEEAAA